MESSQIKLEESWKACLKDELAKTYMQGLKQFLLEEKKHFAIYPPFSLLFQALNLCPLPKVKVVILGQDPYHGAGQAHGLCFSVPDGVPLPPSLVNIFSELQQDLNIPAPKSGNLAPWARQGVLLLNTTLSVRAGNPLSHAGKGWEQFTEKVIRLVNEHCPNTVFMLWGKPAQSRAAFVDASKHLLLQAPHPSPLSAYRGFFGCKHFSRANQYLIAHGKSAIQWQLN